MPFKYVHPVERLAALSVLVPACGCWLWIGAVNNVGRPTISIRVDGKTKKITVARYIVQYIHGGRWGRNLSRRKVGAHSCDDKLCVAPDHVKGSTQRKNVTDCVERGRHVAGSWKQYNETRRQRRHLDCVSRGT